MFSRLQLEGAESFVEEPMASLNNPASVKRSMRAPRGLSPLQRAYLMGFCRARIQARRDVNALAAQFEDLSDEVHANLHVV
jgi:hypothetical protein